MFPILLPVSIRIPFSDLWVCGSKATTTLACISPTEMRCALSLLTVPFYASV